MQITPSFQETLTFVVRLWREADVTGQVRWHGRVEHIETQEVCYAESTAGVIDLIERWTTPEEGSGLLPGRGSCCHNMTT